MAKFTVDTKLFRELGELLVGRESTALVELIKNSYDADATRVRIHGVELESDRGSIIVEDDGLGMTAEDFTKGFLTIAGRTKVAGDRHSLVFGRRFTGEKGVGRLAAHKLARVLNVTSHKAANSKRDRLTGFPGGSGVRAKIDWDAVEDLETLDEVEASDAVVVDVLAGPGQAGTELHLSGLRKAWTAPDLTRFYEEVATLVPPTSLTAPLPRTVVAKPLLFESPKVRDVRTGDPGFTIEYSGAFNEMDRLLPAGPESAAWVIEVNCSAQSREVEISVNPTASFRSAFANAQGFTSKGSIPQTDEHGREIGLVDFQARIFEREQGAWPREYRSVRVYLEGFRVLPYGDRNDDWLELDRDYRSRGRGELGRLRRFARWRVPEFVDDRENLVLKGNNAYFGAVFFTRDGAENLKILANREGFLPSPTWDFVVDTLRHAIGIQVRTRYAATQEAKAAREIDRTSRRSAASRANENTSPVAFLSRELQREALQGLRQARAYMAEGHVKQAQAVLQTTETHVERSVALAEEGASEAVMYRVLASLGLEQAAFVHEILNLTHTAQTIVRALDRAARTPGLASQTQETLKAIAGEARSLVEHLKRNGVYLADMIDAESRQRRSRFSLRARFDNVASFFAQAAEGRSVTIENEIPATLLSPPLFPAEASALFSNLLSNAIKFAGSPGTVLVTGVQDDDWVTVRVENSGASVDLSKSSVWFEPFRSTTHEVDHVLGRGMGLGLTVSRSLMDEYGGEITFVPPSDGFATAVELKWPRR